MSGELDEKALAAGIAVFKEKHGWAGMPAGFPDAIRAYLAASPSPSMEMGVVATAWEAHWPGAGSINSTTKLTKDKNTAARWQDDGAEIEPLVTLSSAQSALAAMRAERDEAYGFMMDARQTADIFEAQVQRLTEENEALRKGKTDIALTALAADGQAQEAYEKLSAAEARIKALEEALRPFAAYAWALRGRRDSEHELGWMGANEAGEPDEVNLTVATFLDARSALKENAR